jgi:hypothetical protein
VTHKSSRNEFSRNSVIGVSSDPVKLRDAGNYNMFDSNTFGANGFPRSSTPPSAHYLEEVNTATGECSSYHNRFANNDLGTFLVGSTANLPVWYLYPAGAGQRVRTADDNATRRTSFVTSVMPKPTEATSSHRWRTS